MAELILMVGIPGSGKSYWASRDSGCKDWDNFITAHISRDVIRLLMIGDSEDYFSKEKAVFREFAKEINDALEGDADYIYVDATHVTKASRAKLLNSLRPASLVDLTVQVMDCDLETCLRRNATRSGFARVPDSAIKRMYAMYEAPTEKELARYKDKFKSIRINHCATGLEE
jgi:tRNA uridine 5-carbamoylmethylation protein Kti12